MAGCWLLLTRLAPREHSPPAAALPLPACPLRTRLPSRGPLFRFPRRLSWRRASTSCRG